MSSLVEYLIANPQVVSYAVTGITAAVSFIFIAKTKKQKKEILEKAFDEMGLHTEALDLLTSSIENSGRKAVRVKEIITKTKPSVSAAAEIILHKSIDAATGDYKRAGTEKEVQDEFSLWATKLLDKEK